MALDPASFAFGELHLLNVNSVEEYSIRLAFFAIE